MMDKPGTTALQCLDVIPPFKVKEIEAITHLFGSPVTFGQFKSVGQISAPSDDRGFDHLTVIQVMLIVLLSHNHLSAS